MAKPKNPSPGNAQAAKVKKPKLVTFPIPKGLNVDGTDKGQEHDMLATFSFDGEGNVTLKAIEGVPVSATKPKPPPKPKADDNESDAGDEESPEADAEGEDEDHGDGTGISDNQTTPQMGGFVDSMDQ